MLPLLRGFEPQHPIVFDRGLAISAAAFCAASVAMSSRLPRSRFAFNLCEGRMEFLLACAAAWLAGHTVVLPPSRLRRVQDELRGAFPDSYCLVDAFSTATVPSLATVVAVETELAGARAAGPWPSPSVDAAHVAAVLFTSGSTGASQPHAKTWGELCAGTQTLLRSFGAPAPGTAILGTLPPQHMFGFETTVMLTLQSGTPLLGARPAYPADLADAVASAAACGVDAIWLMSIPLQLRAFHAGVPTLRGVRRILSATMPLEPELAIAIERDWQAPVEEIFGCTEGGILATRRPAVSRWFTPAAGLAFARNADGDACVSGGHLPQPLLLSDELRPETPGFAGAGRFEVIGRGHDMVKIGGKRASLAALTRELLTVPGVRDGVMFMPARDAQRLAAIVVAPGVAAADVRTALAGRIDVAFVPRPIVMATALPRDANGKLPIDALRAMLSPGPPPAADTQVLVRETTIAADHPALPGHFPGHPIVPGVVLLALVEELLDDHGLEVRACPQVKFLVPVAPGTPLALHVEVSPQAVASFSIGVAGNRVVAGRFACERVRARA